MVGGIAGKNVTENMRWAIKDGRALGTHSGCKDSVSSSSGEERPQLCEQQ